MLRRLNSAVDDSVSRYISRKGTAQITKAIATARYPPRTDRASVDTTARPATTPSACGA